MARWLLLKLRTLLKEPGFESFAAVAIPWQVHSPLLHFTQLEYLATDNDGYLCKDILQSYLLAAVLDASRQCSVEQG